METIVPAVGDWHLCMDDENSFLDFHRVTILAWAIGPNPNAPPIPITPFGRSDMGGDYMIQAVTESTGQFIVLPNGPVLAGNDVSGAKRWLQKQRLGGEA
ncbi:MULTISPECIES: hypothetical protein [Rhodopseudomonas]|uniref:Uncharacterized protein n=1 Tax=Rhodopseudomonas palustris TaxID=1076 RepID=A0A0D7ERZ6_RHOPL|nr:MULTISPECIES: hypothetical protein [Rhodopseudomonas]KIZ43315.1 hypothetical protein OO17_11520 [Rhodopseudomonas palustris]MDF3811285.1 hypothetical protein [Rhodopseudomonas sp. BAL398]WOK18610.1 hypothetical protein RBJ75_03515 [Rhodopseudomonas sp. BAL398]